VPARDPQLENAVEIVLEALKKNPPAKPQRPRRAFRTRKFRPPLRAVADLRGKCLIFCPIPTAFGD
jgi:hypothetical protein